MLTSIVSDNMIIFVAKNPWYALVEVNKDNMCTVIEKLIYFHKIQQTSQKQQETILFFIHIQM